MKRIFDLSLGSIVLIILIFPMMLIALMILFTSKGPVLHWSDRVGRNNVIFRMPKFRSMLISTPVLPKHLLKNPSSYLSPIGQFLRSSSLDELPQIFSVLKGDMSFVGPRAILYNHNDIIEMRTKNDVHKLKPGITGWAQINGRDDISAFDKVMLDTEYLKKRSIWFDLKILWITFFKVLKRDGISH